MAIGISINSHFDDDIYPDPDSYSSGPSKSDDFKVGDIVEVIDSGGQTILEKIKYWKITSFEVMDDPGIYVVAVGPSEKIPRNFEGKSIYYLKRRFKKREFQMDRDLENIYIKLCQGLGLQT